MKSFWNVIHFISMVVEGWIDWFLGGFDGLLYVLIAVVVIEYITNVMCGIVEHNLSSELGFKGISKKVLIFLLVGIANIISMQGVGTKCDLRDAVICFYISREGLSFLTSAVRVGLPVPGKIKTMLEQLDDC